MNAWVNIVNVKRCFLLVTALIAFGAGTVSRAGELNIRSYYSPRNRERPKRKSTRYIILHTTEGPKKGSLKKVHRRGEAHYFVDRAGQVYRIIEKSRVAFHAGRSIWNGKSNLDEHSVGIEVVGYHNRDITEAQYSAVKELLSQLQRIYKVPDVRVLTHSMIAYGVPNRWHRRSHRGRKRCGMLFATDTVRKRLGLSKRPPYDPDVRSGRLVAGDGYLHDVLYGRRSLANVGGDRDGEENVISAGRSAWDIARDRYASAETVYIFPDGRKRKGDKIRDWKAIPPGTRVITSGEPQENIQETVQEIGVHGNTAGEIAGEEYASKTTIYFFPNGRVKQGNELNESELNSLSEHTKMLVGYIYGGHITAKRSAFDVCGKQWDFPSTLYRLPDGSIVPGNLIEETAIPEGSMVFFRH
ncbi:MAG: N-acetylmuramoyl-L-alanine amidase [Kiritimatiellia bacterium]